MTELLLILIFTPLLAAQVFVSPGDVVAIPGASATFFCSTSPLSSDVVISAQWLLNDTLLDVNNVQTLAGTLQLRFSPVSLDYNTTRIRCRGTLTSGNIITSDEVMLLIQGFLSAVGSLSITASNTTLSLTWEPPFTLDITGADPDITGYCVDVINSTSSVTLHSECDVTQPLFSYPIPPNADCHRYNFTVRAVNIVGMGEPATDIYVAVGASPAILEAIISANTGEHSDSNYSLHMSAPACTSELVSFVDTNSGELVALRRVTVTVGNEFITIITDQLRDNRHYNITIRASNSAGEVTSSVEISTHDVSSASLTSNGLLMTNYAEGSNAAGALYEFIFITDSGAVDFTRSALVALNRSTSRNYVFPFSLSAGQYRVSVYDIEQDGILSSGVGYPAVTEVVNLARAEFPQLENCTADSSLYIIEARCAYTRSSMAGGFQVIAKLAALNEIYINHTVNHQSAVTLDVERSGFYQVSIIPIIGENGIANSNVEYTNIVVVTTTTSDTYTSTNASEPYTSSNYPTVSSTLDKEAILSAGIGILALIIGIQFCIIVALCFKIHLEQDRIQKNNSTCVVPNIAPLTPSVEAEVDESQLYAEIKEDSEHDARPAPVLPDHTPVGNTPHDYDDVVLQDPKSGGDYQLTLCEAYGVHQ